MAFAAAAIPYIMAAGAAVSAVSAIQQGQSAKATAKYNAAMAEQNAALAKQDTQVALQQKQRETYLRLGAIRAAQGKGGGAADEGSVLDILGDVASQGELERQRIAMGGAIRERDFTASANLDRSRGKSAETQSYLSAGSELLSGGTDYYLMTRE